MSLTPGTRLGPYEVVSPIGAGGMGEVYRAKDTKLNRDVAIKVLLGSVSHDGERRERFEREAQAIAALNHPNIVTIFGVESDGDTAFLAMELVEGKPLADCIPRGGLSLSQLLKIAIPVADAVAAAHQKGITHRDLKPANIMVGSGEQEGRVKVLDFGLAKLTATTPSGQSTTFMPTALATGEGRILGTVAYMSPEQAEGKAIDARSDLFSLGVILYELATGDRPFTGDTSISIISSIVKDTPKSLTEINPQMPRDLARIVRRALAKDPEKRYQTAKDLRNDLEELKASLDSGELNADPVRGGTPARGGAGVKWRALAIGASAIAVLAIALAVRWRPTAASSLAAAATAAPLTMTPLTSSGNAELATISPDGKYVAYVQTDDGQQTAWVRQVASGSTVRVVAPETDALIHGLTITPDASFIDFVRSTPTTTAALWRVPLLGGTARKIIDEVTSAPGWSADGKQMAYLLNVGNDRHLVVANADGSQPRTIASRTVPARYTTLSLTTRPDVRPIWLPDGRSIVVVGGDELHAPGVVQLIQVDVATGKETELHAFSPAANALGRRHGGLTLVADGRVALLTMAESGPSQVVRVTLPGGESAPLTNDLSTYAGVSVAGDAVVTTRYQTTSGLWLSDAIGHNVRQIGRDMPSEFNGLTWAGANRLMYGAALAGGVGVWSTNLADGTSTLVVPNGIAPSASADGRTLVFGRAGREIWRADGDGTHAIRIPDAQGIASALSPDGSKVFYVSAQSGTQVAWMADLAGGAPRAFSSMRAAASSPPAVSPDGKWLLILNNVPNGGAALATAAILPIDSGGPAGTPVREFRVPSTTLRWTQDGRGIAYADVTGRNIWVQPVDGGPARQLTSFTDRKITDFGWSPDGKQLAIARAAVMSDVVMLKGVK